MRDSAEQVILITGATSGLGSALAAELAKIAAGLLLHGRDEARLQKATEELRASSGNERIDAYRADFASLGQVRAMAERVESDLDRLDVLINNAGIGTALAGRDGRMETVDGHELRFAVNYLAGFLLTRRLLGLLLRSAPARIINVTSAGQAAIDFDDVMLERRYSGSQAYGQSKLAQVMFTFDLAEELQGTGATVNCLHPATLMPTNMVRNAGARPASSLAEGVAATLRLVVDPELDGVSGRYFDGVREARAHRQAYDPEARRRLRELTERLIGS